MFVCIFLLFGFCLIMLLCVPPPLPPPGPTHYIFHMLMARYSLYVLKVPLNTKQRNECNLLTACSIIIDHSITEQCLCMHVVELKLLAALVNAGDHQH